MFSSDHILCGLRIVCSLCEWSTVAHSAVLGILCPSVITVRTMTSHDSIVKLQRLDVWTCCCQSTPRSGFVQSVVSNGPMFFFLSFLKRGTLLHLDNSSLHHMRSVHGCYFFTRHLKTWPLLCSISKPDHLKGPPALFCFQHYVIAIRTLCCGWMFRLGKPRTDESAYSLEFKHMERRVRKAHAQAMKSAAR